MKTLGPPEGDNPEAAVVGALGGSPEAQAPEAPATAQETPPTETPPAEPTVPGTIEPQPAPAEAPPTLAEYIVKSGLTEAQALDALQGYQQSNTLEGQQAEQARIAEAAQTQKPEMFKERLGELLGTTAGLDSLEQAIQWGRERVGAPAAAQPVQAPQPPAELDDLDPGLKTYLTQMSAQLNKNQQETASVRQENTALREQLGQVTTNNGNQAKFATAIQQYGQVVSTISGLKPEVEKELSGDIRLAFDQNPELFQQPGVMKKAVTHFLSKYQRIGYIYGAPAAPAPKPPGPKPKGPTGATPAPVRANSQDDDGAEDIRDVMATLDAQGA